MAAAMADTAEMEDMEDTVDMVDTTGRISHVPIFIIALFLCFFKLLIIFYVHFC
jgi:hypothetical protein